MAFARGEDSRLASFDDTYCQAERTPGYGGRVFPFGSGVPRRRGGCTSLHRTRTQLHRPWRGESGAFMRAVHSSCNR